ncbi:hypothetical protein I6A60_24620 [Frankia sp. AgB1.9]|uniref:hypothetical protein n=1 Tax=unclassified Frankia TaxID=2632575 RepID=UPI00193278AD|nr:MULTISPECIES: hypothetical protein [unclassified Frankia]MBL7490828.1 hypothetical protein [Frankia sp. AgW1.1]MBL7551025.1 hypothetical protein [Frankia sp. AgB1.9]MBL7621194.1 hypothetical protein [Frankia sp. AgB1.8]
MRNSVRSVWTEFNEPIEARLDFMYLDIKGLVTTGLGNLIDATSLAHPHTPTAAERTKSHQLAQRLAWRTKVGDAAATPAQIAAEWDQIKARLGQASHGGASFRNFATLRLPDEEIDRLAFEKLTEMEGALKQRTPFVSFDSFPADAQLGLLSMSWAMGPAFNFPKFQGSVAAGDWATAATRCRFNPDIGGVSLRNDRDQRLFKNAAAVVTKHLNPDELIWPAVA